MPPTQGYVPGAPQPAPYLSQFATDATNRPPENFVADLILPDAQTDTFFGKAAVRPNEELLVNDDDLIGEGTDYPGILWSESYKEWGLGMHGRKAEITAFAIMKAKQAAKYGGGSDPLFNLEQRVTGILVAQNLRRIQLLKWRAITTEATYPAGHVMASIEIDTADNVRETIIEASEIVESAGQGPANLIVFGRGATRGADRNAALLELLPDTAPRVLSRSLIQQLSRLPEDQTRVEFANAVYRETVDGDDIPMFDNYIFVGRVKAAPDGRQSFGWTYWIPNDENGQRVYINRVVLGVQENREIGLRNFYIASPEDFSLGVLIPTTVSA